MKPSPSSSKPSSGQCANPTSPSASRLGGRSERCAVLSDQPVVAVVGVLVSFDRLEELIPVDRLRRLGPLARVYRFGRIRLLRRLIRLGGLDALVAVALVNPVV